ncbi:MAG: hypothetical protein HUU46_08280 [Candidatus Hydrogenedentes bacterium]|nr:hypothetical protein [Candidatus Hydrogenedentota bacterium]
MDNLDRLVAYTCWANRTWLDFVHAHAAKDDFLTMTISHIYLAEQIWFQRIYGEELRGDVFSTLTKPELEAIASRVKERYAEQLESDLHRVLRYTRLNGEAMESVVLDILNHLVTHGSHHRGQMARHAAQGGLKPPETSFIGFSRKH